MKEGAFMKKVYNFHLLVTSDIHGHLLPINYADNSPSTDSLANIHTLIRKLRRPETILIDLGDAIQGSPLMEYHRLSAEMFPNPVAECFNRIGYDYFVPGNHDFNFGRDYLDNFLLQLEAKTLCANILEEDLNPAFGEPYVILEPEEGLKIAIIGLTTQYIPHWERETTTAGLVFENAYEKAKELVDRIRNDPEVRFVVVCYHGGFEKDLETFEPYVEDTGENLGSRMLEKIPDIDVLLTGHQHRKICQMVGKTMVVQPMCYGQAVAEISVVFNAADDWKPDNIEAVLHETANTKARSSCGRWLRKIEKKTQKYLDAMIGIAPDDDMLITDMFEARLHKHKVVTFINQVQMQMSGAMISCCSLGNEVTGFNRHISIRNILSTYVFPNILVVVRISGRKLKLALEKNAEYFVLSDDRTIANPRYSYPKKEHYNYDMFDGIDYVIDVSQPFGKRIQSLKYKGREVVDTDEFTLAMNNYRASGGGEFNMFRGLEVVEEIPIDITEMLIAEVKRLKEVSVVDPKNIMIINSRRK